MSSTHRNSGVKGWLTELDENFLGKKQRDKETRLRDGAGPLMSVVRPWLARE